MSGELYFSTFPVHNLVACDACSNSGVLRFGQTVIQDCTHCKTADQYALFAVTGPLLQYIREASILGLLTVENSGRSQWRTVSIASLVAAFLAEAYIAATVPIVIPRDGGKVTMVGTAFVPSG
jgi:hypothetical protein